MASDKPFGICPMCYYKWDTQEEFITDSSLRIDGYMADFEVLDASLFYFTHMRPECGSTFTMEAQVFLNLYNGEKYVERRTGEEECPAYCQDKENLNRCDALCECAFNREIIQIIKKRQSEGTPAP